MDTRPDATGWFVFGMEAVTLGDDMPPPPLHAASGIINRVDNATTGFNEIVRNKIISRFLKNKWFYKGEPFENDSPLSF